MNDAINRALRKVGATPKKPRKEKTCEWCHGTGWRSNDRGYSTQCGACGGKGKVDAEIRRD